MFAPTACTTPTRLPTLMWSLAAAMLLLGAFAPAFATQTHAEAAITWHHDSRLETGWRVLPLEQVLHTALWRRAHAPARLVPLAVMPSQRSALWFGVGATRSAGARVELRWTMPLDGSAPDLRALAY
jgi:hypothetical protein